LLVEELVEALVGVLVQLLLGQQLLVQLLLGQQLLGQQLLGQR
jgi:hypothetical protein